MSCRVTNSVTETARMISPPVVASEVGVTKERITNDTLNNALSLLVARHGSNIPLQEVAGLCRAMQLEIESLRNALSAMYAEFGENFPPRELVAVDMARAALALVVA